MNSANFDTWLEAQRPRGDTHPRFVLHSERVGGRAATVQGVVLAIHDHLIGIEHLKQLRSTHQHPDCLRLIQNSLPDQVRIRSGDLGEILATEWIPAKVDFSIPIKRLRFKDDRNTAMRGVDVVGLRLNPNPPHQILKVECKSRGTIAGRDVSQAVDGLTTHSSRPNPSTLGFIARRLREQNRDDEALVFEKFQIDGVQESQVEHMIFVLTGNDPSTALGPHLDSSVPGIVRHVVGIRVEDHQAFIEEVFKSANG